MLNLLWQEILILKEYSFFIRNLSVTTVLTILITMGLGEIYHHPTRLAQQQKLEAFSTVVWANKVMKTVGSSRR